MFIPYHDDNSLHRFPVITVLLIVLNVGSYFAFLGLEKNDPHAARVAAVRLGFVPRELTNLASGQPVLINLYPEISPDDPAPFQLVNDPQQGPALPPPEERTIEVRPTFFRVACSLLTCMFMHADIYHLGFNMLFFWVFGNNIEDRLGRISFTLYYLLGGMMATLCHWAMTHAPFDAQPMIGASGAVAVMLGAYAVTYPRAKIHVLFLLFCVPLFFELPALLVLGGWILIELYHAWQEQQGLITNVALWAHIGGFFFGAVTMPFLPVKQYPEADSLAEFPDEPGVTYVEPLDSYLSPQQPDSTGIRWEDRGP